MVVIQIILSVILLWRIGEMLLKKINADFNIWTINIIVIGLIASLYDIRSITTILLFGATVFCLILHEIYRRQDYVALNNKYLWVLLDIVEAGLVIALIIVYIYCSL